MKLLQQLCSVPTAPFAEGHVVAFVEAFVAKRKNLTLLHDRFGNLLIESKQAKSKQPRWVFAAHMDHPGFVATKMLDARTLEAAFRGWVAIEYVKNARVRFFDGTREIAGQVIEATSEEYERLAVPSNVKIRVKSAVSPGCPGMFDQGIGRLKGKRFYSRVCDDLAGAAAALTMIDALHRKPPEAPVAVLLTRAEEEGFIGAMAAVLHPKLLREDDRIVAIECSAKQTYAVQGEGAIIRVGDKTSIFNSQLTYFLGTQAEALAKKDKRFKFQRALMPGGTCEATVYDVYGYLACSICVALGNYHNMNRDTKKIGPEYIDIDDWQNVVKLFLSVARNAHTFEPGHKPLRERVEKRFEKLKGFLG